MNGMNELVFLQDVLLFIVCLYLFFLHALLILMVDKDLYLLWIFILVSRYVEYLGQSCKLVAKPERILVPSLLALSERLHCNVFRYLWVKVFICTKNGIK